MKKLLLILPVVLLLAAGCNSSQSTDAQPNKPFIDNINPASGTVNASVKIIGSGFTAKNNKVNIGQSFGSEGSFGFDFGNYFSPDGKAII